MTIDELIEQALLAPKKMQVAGESVEAQTLADVIAAAEMLANLRATPRAAIRIIHVVPGGNV